MEPYSEDSTGCPFPPTVDNNDSMLAARLRVEGAVGLDLYGREFSPNGTVRVSPGLARADAAPGGLTVRRSARPRPSRCTRRRIAASWIPREVDGPVEPLHSGDMSAIRLWGDQCRRGT